MACARQRCCEPFFDTHCTHSLFCFVCVGSFAPEPSSQLQARINAARMRPFHATVADMRRNGFFAALSTPDDLHTVHSQSAQRLASNAHAVRRPYAHLCYLYTHARTVVDTLCVAHRRRAAGTRSRQRPQHTPLSRSSSAMQHVRREWRRLWHPPMWCVGVCVSLSPMHLTPIVAGAHAQEHIAQRTVVAGAQEDCADERVAAHQRRSRSTTAAAATRSPAQQQRLAVRLTHMHTHTYAHTALLLRV